MPRWTVPLAVVAMLTIGAPARAQLVEDKSAEYKTETVLSGLDNPWGLAIRGGREVAGPHEVFIAESGAGRVIRVSTDEPQTIHEVVTGFHVGESATLPEIGTGPLGLAFLTRTKLVVTGGSGDEKQHVSVFVLSGDNAAQSAELADHSVNSARMDDRTGTLWAITMGPTVAFATLNRAGRDGAVLKADHEANRLESLRPLAVSRSGEKLYAPAGLTVTPSDRPPFVVVGDMGDFDTQGDSRLLFFTPQSGALALALETGLSDISGLAYSSTGQLYAVDAALEAPGQGGVYRLEDARREGHQACRAVKVAAVTRGISLAFAPDGTLYVTSLGPSGRSKAGSLVKITGSF